MLKTLFVATVAVIAFGLVEPASAAGGTRQEPSSRPSAPEPEPKTPEELALEHYSWGISQRDRAWSLEEKLSEATTDKARAKLEKKIRKAYRQAAGEFESAVRQNPQMFQAHSDLGYCRRKLGDYPSALEAYDVALSIEPGYPEAVEYRGEAYLGLGQLEDAKQAYLELFGGRREYADKLLDAMTRWVEGQRSGETTVDGGALDAFADWVAEREEIAGQTKPISQLPQHRW